MSFGIIIRGKNQPSKSKHFRPHYNTSMGKYYSTKDDFHKDLKDKGMEMYDERTVKKPETKKYTPSKWCREISKAGMEQMKRDGKVSGAVMKEIVEKTNMKPTPRNLDIHKGGIHGE